MKYIGATLMALYQAAFLYTFAFLTFFDGIRYNWWNWFFIVPINLFLAQIWPIYWGIVRWLF